MIEGFTKNFNVNKLVYYEQTENVESAIQREKKIKNWKRIKKVELITSFNRKWEDQYEKL
jgi:putative endonuclease